MRPRPPPQWLAAVALAGLVLASPARADPSHAAATSSLAWVRSEGAESCIAGKELADAVEHILGRRIFVSASAADVSIEGHIDKMQQGFKATLRISDDHGALLGVREVQSQGADCQAIEQPLAFVIAVLIDPDAAAHAAPPISPPQPEAPAPAPPPAPPPSPRWAIAPRLGLSMAFGELPSVAWGATAALRLGPDALGVELLGSFFLPQDAAVPGTSQASVHFTWAYAGAVLCPTLARVAPVSFVACAGALGGVLTATPRGLANEQGSTNFVAVATLRAGVEWRITPALFAAASGSLDVPFQRPVWTDTTAGGSPSPLFQPSAVGAGAEIAIGLRFE
jgi:hypothetical protein